ncbi:elongation factor G [Agrobacterium tumefaciens]|uniref:Ribosomal protection tetracycline resistance protein n=1 Tax=Agrobacterium tumefaciens TaxID=358 RepID=A0A2L2LHF5_AGRTU|nr:TetM/TetW/TetO/TetS family tetracycline resistance ribosomal protection protein [Agrobacterium tumefaciens]AVH43706.1 ribosomal protection tetracycline resistance protein [Agrobacterium tumefaciens]NSY97648.1 TetM/TetW/TetO/TetS family tetracycline resistance ribosomal protection protein [Agrobacterium tumefaciens]
MRTLNLGILAHVDAGKTSLTERLLFDTGAIDKLGTVDGGNTQTDSLELERQRGITIAAAVAAFRIGDLAVNLIDTPGHPDFIAEVERVLRLLDAAIVVVSAVEGIQAQTRVLVRALQRLEIPFLFFVNKIDRVGARYEDVLADIARQLAARPLAMSSVTNIGSRRAVVEAVDMEREPHLSRLCETLALDDATLLDDYIVAPERLGTQRLQKAIAKQVSKGLVHPAYGGIAMTGSGVPDLIDAIETLLPSRLPDPLLPVRGSVFKIERGWGGEKLAYINLEAGTVSARGTIELPTGSAKITSLQVFREPGLRRCDHARAGQIVKVGGLAGARIGDLIGPDTGRAFMYQFAPPTIETRVVARRPSENRALWLALQQLSEQDPLINLRSMEDASEMYLSLYGEVQKEIVQATLLAEFGVDATFEESTVIYVERPTNSANALETIFRDPNPFLATIGLRVEPRPSGSGNTYTVEADVGQMPISFYRAIEETVLETLKAGVFGWQVIDCQVVLTDVRHSSPSSTAADFRGLTPLVLAEALSHAGMVVCEPVEHFQLEIPSTTLPGMVTLLAKCGASISETLIENSVARLDGMIASIHVQSIRRQLPELTSGVGIMESTFDHHASSNSPPPLRSRTSANPFNRVEFLTMTRR